jgi:hypothetical protein
VKLKIKVGRRHVEGVVEASTYPEPWPVYHIGWMRFLYRALLGRPMDNVRWTNSTFLRSASTGEASVWLRLAGWHRALIRVVSTWLLMLTLPLTLMLMLGEQWSAWALTLIHWHIVAMSAPLLMLDHYFRKEHGVRIPWCVEEHPNEQLELSDEQQQTLSAVEQEELLALTERRWRMLTVAPGRKAWERDVLEPLAAVVSSVLGDASAHRPGEARHWIEVPRDYMQPTGAPVEITLPRSYTGAVEVTNKKLVSAARHSLGMLEADARWLLKGRNRRLLLSAPPAPPAIAHFRDYEQQLMSTTQECRPVLGVVASGELMSAEMVNDSPHIAVSAGSGAGKSELIKSPLMQALHWGWAAIILDYKGESQEWAKGLPGVTYVSTVQGIHDMGVRLGEEMERRKALSPEERKLLPRILVVREEWNMAAALLADYWAELRAINMQLPPLEREAMPPKSPALKGFSMVIFMGRSFGVFDLLAAQRMSNRVFNGNVDIRENYMIRILARYTVQTWKMLLPHIKFMKKPKNLGGWVVAAGDEAMYVQGILISDKEAQDFARAGAPNPMSAFSSGNRLPQTQQGGVSVKGSNTQGGELRPDAAGHSEPAAALTVAPHPVMLRKLVDIATSLEYLDITHHILRNASRTDEKGDPTFPPARGGKPTTGYLYDVSEVTEWARKRRAAEAAARERVGR